MLPMDIRNILWHLWKQTHKFQDKIIIAGNVVTGEMDELTVARNL